MIARITFPPGFRKLPNPNPNQIARHDIPRQIDAARLASQLVNGPIGKARYSQALVTGTRGLHEIEAEILRCDPARWRIAWAKRVNRWKAPDLDLPDTRPSLGYAPDISGPMRPENLKDWKRSSISKLR